MPHGSMPPGFSPADWCGLRCPPRPDQAAARGPFDRVHVLRRQQPPPGAGGGDQPVRAVELEVRALERRRWAGAPRAGTCCGVQRRHVVVLLERVGEDLPVAVVVGDEIVALGHLFERVVVEGGDHRAEELPQALPWFRVEVDEDEPVPHVAVHRAQPVLRLVEVEELVLLLHERQRAVEAVAPAVVLAGELPAGASDLLVGKVVPHQLVSAVTADVVEGADLSGPCPSPR